MIHCINAKPNYSVIIIYYILFEFSYPWEFAINVHAQVTFFQILDEIDNYFPKFT